MRTLTAHPKMSSGGEVMKRQFTIMVLLALIAAMFSAIPASAQTNNDRMLGKRFASLGNPASGWSTAFTPGSTDYWRTGGYASRSHNLGTDANPIMKYHKRNMVNLREQTVFHGALTHNDGNRYRDYQLRLGKGSQIYSIISDYGEVIGPQYDECGSMHYWNDTVLQLAFRPIPSIPDRHKNADHCTSSYQNGTFTENRDWFYSKNADIHQAGTYRTDNLGQAFFSPMVFTANSRHSVSSVVWPQSAHAPTNYASNLMVEQTVTDMAPNNEPGTAGVIKVETTTHNFGTEAVGAGLWSSFNANLFDLDPTTTRDESYMWTSILGSNGVAKPVFCSKALYNCSDPTQSWKQSDLTAKGNFGGIVALGRPLNGQRGTGVPSETWGMAIAVGTDMKKVKLGGAAGAGLILSADLNQDIQPGQSQTYTYFLVFDRLDRALNKARAQVANAKLVTAAAPVRPTANATRSTAKNLDLSLRVPVCSGSLRGQGWDSCRDLRSSGGGVTRAYAYNGPVREGRKTAVPIFVLKKKNSNAFYLTSDPYGRSNSAFTAFEWGRTTGWRTGPTDRNPTPVPLRTYEPVLRPYGSQTPTVMKELLGYAFKGRPSTGCYQPFTAIRAGLPADVTAESDLYVACR